MITPDSSSINQNKLQTKLALASNFSAVAIAAALPLSTTATDILFIVTVLLNLAAGDLKAKFAFILNNRVAIGLLAFYVLFLIGMIYSTAPWSGALHTFSKYDKLFFAAFLIPIFKEEKWRKYAINVFLFTMLFVMVTSYVKAGWGLLYGYSSEDFSVFKVHISYNFLMSFFAYLVLLKIYAMPVLNKQKWLWIGILVLAVFDIFFMNISRTGYLVFTGLVILFCVQNPSWKNFLIALLSISLIIGVAFTVPSFFRAKVYEAVANVKDYKNKEEDTSIGLRMVFVKNSIALIKKHPIFGTGTGSYPYEYANIKPIPEVLSHNPHNEYLLTTVQFGVVGLLLLSVLFGSQLWYSRFLPKKMRDMAQGIIIALMLGSLVNSLLSDTTEGHLYAYFIALTFATSFTGSKTKLSTGSRYIS